MQGNLKNRSHPCAQVLTIRSYEPRDAVGEIQNLTPSDRGKIEVEIVQRVPWARALQSVYLHP